METNAYLALMFGLVVRLGLPMPVTLLVVTGLRRLDTRWQKEAEIERNLLTRDEEPRWKETSLAMDEIKARAAENGKPCWQIHRLSNGYLRGVFRLDCEVFVNAPALAFTIEGVRPRFLTVRCNMFSRFEKIIIAIMVALLFAGASILAASGAGCNPTCTHRRRGKTQQIATKNLK
ncbi:MAG: hypothetical protein IPJ47_22920 [Anaerolineales bacterium]|nr:hypothetical protein [Anaerolineales bacterium]